MTQTDEYQIQSRAQFDLSVRQLEFVARMQAEYGKWVIATLLFLHSSSLAGLLFKSQASEHPRAVACFAIGAAFAIMTGAAAWVNFFSAMLVYTKFCDVRMLVDQKHWPSADGIKTHQLWSRCAMYIALACVFISLTLWLAGAGLLLAKEAADARMIQMALSKLFSMAGILIELVGFVVLALELLRTNKDLVSYTDAIASNATTATTIVGYESGPGEAAGRIELQGGTVGALSPSAQTLRDQVSSGKKKTLLGLGLTGIGVLLQFIGTILG